MGRAGADEWIAIRFVRDDAIVRTADMAKLTRFFVIRELRDRIRAQKGERIFFHQIVPEHFQLDGGAFFALSPKDGDHFTERANSGAVLIGDLDDWFDGRAKTAGVRSAIDHETGERFMRVIDIVYAATLVFERVSPAIFKPLFDGQTMRRRQDKNRAMILHKALRDIRRYGLNEEVLVLIKLNKMIPITDVFEVLNSRNFPGGVDKMLIGTRGH